MASKSIDILTAQNVKLTYELASPIARILATIIDGIVLTVIILILFLIFGIFRTESTIFYWILFLLYTFYHLISEATMGGRSLGKMALGIRVMKTNGGRLEFSDLFLRWILRIVDISLSIGAIGLTFILSTDTRQRLGDMMAGTCVIKVNYSVHFNLQDIQRLHQAINPADIVFPEVAKIEEKHILFIKNLLNNYNNYQSGIYQNAIFECANKMRNLLQVDNTDFADDRKFLYQIVKDFIAITR